MNRSHIKSAILLFSITVLALSSPACKFNENKGTVTSTKKYETPFNAEHNTIMLPVRVGDSRKLKVILDTGMHFEGLLLYNVDQRDSITLKNAIEVFVPGAGGDSPSTALMADSVSFFIGDQEFPNQRVIMLQNDIMQGFPSDGVTGYTLFGNYAVEIDYDRMMLLLHEPPIKVDSSWYLLPLTFKDNKIPWIQAAININGDEEVPISCYIDLASSDALELLIRDTIKFTPPDNLEDAYLGRGLSGDIYGQKGVISYLKLGRFYLKDVVTHFAPAEIRSKQENADGIIGNNALRRFNIVFDYAGGRLYLKPSSHFNEPF
jgi:hypothetical protein